MIPTTMRFHEIHLSLTIKLESFEGEAATQDEGNTEYLSHFEHNFASVSIFPSNSTFTSIFAS